MEFRPAQQVSVHQSAGQPSYHCHPCYQLNTQIQTETVVVVVVLVVVVVVVAVVVVVVVVVILVVNCMHTQYPTICKFIGSQVLKT